MMTGLRLIAALVLVPFFAAPPAIADDRAASNPDRSIAGCTRIIEARDEPIENLCSRVLQPRALRR